MNIKTRLDVYDIDSYDQHLCLKPTWPLIATIVFLCRHFVLTLLAGASSFSGASGDLLDLIDIDRDWRHFAAGLPALTVLVSLFARTPAAHRLVRWIWQHGRGLLIGSIVAHALLVPELGLLHGSLGTRLESITLASAIEMALTLLVLFYLLFSSRVRNTFRDFPIAADSSTDARRELSPADRSARD